MSVPVQRDLDVDADPVVTPSARAGASRGRGRPLEMTAAQVLDSIRQLSAGGNGLYRVHLSHSALYARARRQFGSWAAAVVAAGVDYAGAIGAARRRAGETRRARRRNKIRER